MDYKDKFNCRFCQWDCSLKKDTKSYINTIKRHFKTKHKIDLKQHDAILLVSTIKKENNLI